LRPLAARRLRGCVALRLSSPRLGRGGRCLAPRRIEPRLAWRRRLGTAVRLAARLALAGIRRWRALARTFVLLWPALRRAAVLALLPLWALGGATWLLALAAQQLFSVCAGLGLRKDHTAGPLSRP
jgi:hypothetical protein